MSGPAESISTIELKVDDERQIEVVITFEPGDRSVVTITDPRRPTALTYSSVTSGGSSWWTKGDVTSKFEIDIAALVASTRSNGAPLTGRIHHRRCVAHGRVNVEATDHGHRLRITAVARGRGLVRPIVAVCGGLFGGLIRRSLDESFSEWEAEDMPVISKLNQPGDPRQLATAWLVDLLAPYGDPAHP